jgi:thioredoxin 1
MTCEFVTKIIRLFKIFVNKYKNGREIGYNTNIIIEEKEKKMAVIHLTKDNFKEEVLESNVPVLVDFWATWCGPCQMVGPVIEEIAGEVTDAKICKVDVDANPELARDYRVMSIPTLMVFKNGEAVKREVGAKPKAEILDMLR